MSLSINSTETLLKHKTNQTKDSKGNKRKLFWEVAINCFHLLRFALGRLDLSDACAIVKNRSLPEQFLLWLSDFIRYLI